ncbi:hypothetical protein [Streptomyces sp. SS]|uniref:hypothetical protein n=1 Tax=Streptomyces sp. SS TaxID=260742 RepID=UPI000FFBBF66|nr:hypothetical protein [Streptomyces sp. SS]
MRLLADAAYVQGLVLLLLCGRPREALATADRALAIPHDSAPAQARCRLVRVFALTASGLLKMARAEAQDLKTARADTQHLRADAVAAGEHWTRSYTEYRLAVMALSEERPADAVTHARAMLRDKRTMGDAFGLGLGLDLLHGPLRDHGRDARS